MFEIFDKNKIDYYAPSNEGSFNTQSQSVLILTGDDTHDLELFYPYYRLVEEGYKVDVATPKGGEIKGKFGMLLKNTLVCQNVTPEDYSLLYIPGGKAPAALREHQPCVTLVQRFAATGKPIAAICHGAQLLVTADLVRGKRIAAWPDVKDEIENAGGTFADTAAIQDGQFITGRWPGDLPAHLKAVLAALRAGNALASPRRAAS